VVSTIRPVFAIIAGEPGVNPGADAIGNAGEIGAVAGDEVVIPKRSREVAHPSALPPCEASDGGLQRAGSGLFVAGQIHINTFLRGFDAAGEEAARDKARTRIAAPNVGPSKQFADDQVAIIRKVQEVLIKEHRLVEHLVGAMQHHAAFGVGGEHLHAACQNQHWQSCRFPRNQRRAMKRFTPFVADRDWNLGPPSMDTLALVKLPPSCTRMP
jgi:hypothetical protein